MPLTNVILLLSAISCNAQTACSDIEHFSSVEEHAKVLTHYFDKAKNASGQEKRKFEQLFFCAFPSSFSQMQDLYGYDNNKGAAPLYTSGGDQIVYFSNLNSIAPEKYYNKSLVSG